MPEFPFLQSGIARTVGAVPASTEGTTVTSGGSNNTKGSWVEIVAATERDTHWIQIQIGNFSNVFDHFLDIGIGAATEEVIIPDLYFSSKGAGGGSPAYLFPIFIPAGSRVSARHQSSSSNITVQVVLTLFSGTLKSGGSGPSKVSAYGAVASTVGTLVDPGGTANTDSSWVELTAATERDHNWLVLAGRYGDFTLAASTRWMVDIGIGSATEQEIISDLFLAADVTSDRPFNTTMCFPYFVPKGSRIAIRLRSSVTTTGDRTALLKLYCC